MAGRVRYAAAMAMGDATTGHGAALVPPDEVTCRACGERAAGPPVHVRELMFATRETWTYRRCITCGSLTMAVVPADMAPYYPDAYYSRTGRHAFASRGRLRAAAGRLLAARRLFGHRSPLLPLARRVTAVPPELRELEWLVREGGLRSFDDPILDVGSGAEPDRLAKLHLLGFRQVSGIEPFMPADAAFRGVTIRRATIDQVDGRYRLVMFNHSLEHVPDPASALRHARRLLEPGGRILVRTPIMGTWFWREYGPSWVEIDAPRHLVLFSIDGLDRLAGLVGLRASATTWESGAWEVIASEQYRRDIGMFEAGSYFVDRASSAFDEDMVRAFKRTVDQLNADGDAGRARIWLDAV